MSNKLFLPFLTDDIGRSLDVNNSVVVTSAIPNPLENAPEGWEKNIVQFSRNTEFRGIIKAYITNLKFYLKGATILRNAFYRLGMETVIFFIWLKQNRNFGAGMKYEGWYKGEVDFSSYKDEYDGVEVNVTEGGYYKDLQANKAIIQEIPFDKDAVKIYMDGLNLHQKIKYEDITQLPIDENTYGTAFYGGMSLISQDGSSVGFLISNESLLSVSSFSWAQKMASLNTILTNVTAKTVSITIAGTIEFKCTGMTSSPAFALKFRFLRSHMPIDPPNQDRYLIINTGAMVVGTTYTQDFSIVIPLEAGESLFREGVFFGGPGTDAIIEFSTFSKWNITFVTRTPPNIIDAYRVQTLGEKLTIKVSKGATLMSPVFEPDYNLMVTCGDAIRNIPKAVIKSTWSDFYKSIDAVKCLSLKVVDNNPVILSRYDDFNTTTIADLGECNKWELEPAKEYIYSGVDVGYPSKGTDSNIDVNGKYSFNNTFVWALNITRKDASVYQAVAAYFADPYDIELIRVNFNQKDTTAGSTDNSVFFLDCELKTASFTGTVNFSGSLNKLDFVGSTAAIDDFIVKGSKIQVTGSTLNNQVFTVTVVNNSPFFGLQLTVLELVADESAVVTVSIYNFYQLRRVSYATTVGIPDDGTVFNIEISPRRNLNNHLRWLRSSFDHLDTKKLIFKSTEKNSYLGTFDSAGVGIVERRDIAVSSMGAKVFLPYYTLSEFASPENLLDLMTANSSGKFNYKRNGQDMEGFPIDIKTDDSYLTTQQYRLLLTANNDLTKLILR